jgi:cupin fold WbuC family metalloprotein
MIAINKESDEVLYPQENIVSVNREDMQKLKDLAICNPRQRIRLCAHKEPSDQLHEMFIIHTSECYVRPHKHIGKIESMSILEGEADVVLFHEDGSIKKVLSMGAPNTGKLFYYRLAEPIYHMLLIRTPFLVFHEITQGPFLREKTIFPEWAPEENSPNRNKFVSKIESLIR